MADGPIDWSDVDWEHREFHDRVERRMDPEHPDFRAMMQQLFSAGLSLRAFREAGTWRAGSEAPWHAADGEGEMSALSLNGEPFEVNQPRLNAAVTLDDGVLECQLLGSDEEVLTVMLNDEGNEVTADRMFRNLAYHAPRWLVRILTGADPPRPGFRRRRTHSLVDDWVARDDE